jgi:hypothetical protein
MNEDEKRLKLQIEIKKLFDNKWKPLLESDFPIINKIKGHGTKIKKIDEFYKVTNLINLKLSPITTSIFLKFFGTLDEFPGINIFKKGPYQNKQKGLLIFQLLSGIFF